MSNPVSRARSCVGLFGVLSIVAPSLTAQSAGAPPDAPLAYTGTTANLESDVEERLRVHILRWSTADERVEVRAALDQLAPAKEGSASSADALTDLPTVGYVWTEGSLGYALKYAATHTGESGLRDIVLVTDRPVGAWDREGPWRALGQDAASERPFTLIQLRVDAAGRGEGRMSLGAAAIENTPDDALVLADYDAEPVTLQDLAPSR